MLLKYQLHFVALVLMLSGCLSIKIPNRYWNQMECYSGESTGIDSLIRIDGYYVFDTIIDVPEYLEVEDGELVKTTNKAITNTIFFTSDGFAIKNFSFLHSVDSIENPKGMHRIGAGSQGVYRVHGDTIFVQTLYWTDQNISPIEAKYVIRNGTSLELVDIRDFTKKNTQPEQLKLERSIISREVYEFTQFSQDTDLNQFLYIKNKKNFYCNEEMYSAYKKQLE